MAAEDHIVALYSKMRSRALEFSSRPRVQRPKIARPDGKRREITHRLPGHGNRSSRSRRPINIEQRREYTAERVYTSAVARTFIRASPGRHAFVEMLGEGYLLSGPPRISLRAGGPCFRGPPRDRARGAASRPAPNGTIELSGRTFGSARSADLSSAIFEDSIFAPPRRIGD